MFATFIFPSSVVSNLVPVLVILAVLVAIGLWLRSRKNTGQASAAGSQVGAATSAAGASSVPSTIIMLSPKASGTVSKPSNLTLTAWGATDIGGRANNEDNILIAGDLFLVADGMGGADCGEKASAAIVDEFGKLPPTTGRNWFRLGLEASRASMKRFQATDATCKKTGSTLTAARRNGSQLELCWLGDSHFFRLRGGELKRLTVEHSMAMYLLQRGWIKEEDIADHPQRTDLLKCVGPEGATPDWDTESFEMEAGDIYLLCSDGLTDYSDLDRIKAILSSGKSAKETVEELIAMALADKTKDNVCAIVIIVS